MPMLRSRSKGEENNERRQTENTPNAWFTSNDVRKTAKYRFRLTKLRCVSLTILLVTFWGYMRSRLSQNALEGQIDGIVKAHNGMNQTHVDDLQMGHTLENETFTEVKSPGEFRHSAKWKYPLVDRTMLDKLDRMQEFYAPEYYQLGSASPIAKDLASWPPRVTRVPERPSRQTAAAGHAIKTDATDAICESTKHPRPCRFLLPLRVAEQESKARIHLAQIVQLAWALNRTLVLPNVGKSKIGACFKWDLGTYYDVSSLEPDEDLFVEQKFFRGWLDSHERQGAHVVKSQLISIGSALPADTRFRERSVYSNPDVSVLAYHSFGAWERDLPGCFASKLEKLGLETMPVFMSTTNAINRDGGVRLIGDSIVDAFSAISARSEPMDVIEVPLESNGFATSPETQVLVVNWDLRHPIFPPSINSLQYSNRMHDLAARQAPKTPYLVVQWRMETVNPELLKDCAHALVDVLSRILHDFALAENITTVWFASDYPYPIVKHTSSQRQPVVIAKSGTFRDFEVRHEEAIDILRKAFVKGCELGNWVLTDFAEAMEMGEGIELDSLQDSGVLGILDKLVSIKANLFVSGASRCSRRSSFTKQVVEARNEEWSRSRESHLRNVVEIFG